MEGNWFKAWVVFCLALGLGVWGFLIWAIYQLVTWVTAQ